MTIHLSADNDDRDSFTLLRRWLKRDLNKPYPMIAQYRVLYDATYNVEDAIMSFPSEVCPRLRRQGLGVYDEEDGGHDIWLALIETRVLDLREQLRVETSPCNPEYQRHFKIKARAERFKDADGARRELKTLRHMCEGRPTLWG